MVQQVIIFHITNKSNGYFTFKILEVITLKLIVNKIL